MSYVVIDNFNLGLDDRRSLLTAKPGTLSRLENAHITRGGEIERRAENKLVYPLTIGKGLQATDSGLYQFGSADYNSSVTSVYGSLELKYPRYPSPPTTDVDPPDTYSIWIPPVPATDYALHQAPGTTFTDYSGNITFGKNAGSGSLGYDGFYEDLNGCMSYNADNTQLRGTMAANAKNEVVYIVVKVNAHSNGRHILSVPGGFQLKQGTASGEVDCDVGGGTLTVTGVTYNVFHLFVVERNGTSATLRYYNGASSFQIPASTDTGTVTAASSASGDIVINEGDTSGNIPISGYEFAEVLIYDEYSSYPGATTVTAYFQSRYLSTPRLPLIYYQRLQHPDGSTAMSSVEFSTVFNGKAFVVAKFADGSYQAFYNGTIIPDFYAGEVRGDHADIGEMLDEIATEIDNATNYTAGVGNSETLRIERTDGTDFTVAITATDGGGTADEDWEILIENEAVPAVAEVASKGRVLLQNGGSGDTITNVTVGGVSILGSTVNWTTNDVNTAKLLAAAINASSPATGTVSRIEVVNAGQYYIGTPTITITDAAGGSGSGATATANMTEYVASGYDGSTYNNAHTFYKIESITITNPGSGYSGPITVTINDVDSGASTVLNGLSAASPFATREGSAVGHIENGSGKVTNYTASPAGAYVVISGGAGTGASPDGETIAVTTTGSLTATETEAMGQFQAGSYPVPGTNKIYNITFSGTVEAGDQYRLVLTDDNSDTLVAGGARVLGVTPVTAKSFKQKLYLAAGGNLYYSALDDATEWESDSDGSGVINMQTEFSDYSGIKAVTTYQNNLAVFSRRSGQIWFVDPDDSLNQQIQILENVGALSPGSAVTMGDSDVLFVSDFGIRSLRVRDSSNAAFVSDVGTPIDATIISEIASMTSSQISSITSAVEPKNGRYLAYINDKLYVLSFFPGSKISAWSTYTLGYGSIGETMASVEKMEPFDGELYIVSGVSGESYFQIHVLGDSVYELSDSANISGTTYVETPYIDAGRPGDLKRWTGIDMSATGTWDVYMNCDPQDDDAWELIARSVGTTAGLNKVTFDAHGTHVRFQFRETGATQSKISNLIVHFEQLNEE